MKDKLCKKCGEVKPLTEFHKAPRNTGTGYASYCKPCVTKNAAISNLNNKVNWYQEDGYMTEKEHFNAAIENYAKVFNLPSLLRHKLK